MEAGLLDEQARRGVRSAPVASCPELSRRARASPEAGWGREPRATTAVKTTARTTVPAAVAPERVIPAAQRCMAVILEALESLPAGRKPKLQPPPALRAELDTWTQRVGGQELPPAILLRGVIFWSRLHGLVSLELDRHLASMQLDPELLYRTELAEFGAQT